MTVDDFRQSLAADDPPPGLTLALAGLWWDAKGDWIRAHKSAQQYWYSRARKPVCRDSLDAEWLGIAVD